MKTWIASPAEYLAMTPKEQSEYRYAVEMAAHGGAFIDYCKRNGEHFWNVMPTDRFLWDSNVYRIRRKPAEVWIWKFNDDDFSIYRYYTKEDCEKSTLGAEIRIPGRAVRFVAQEE